MRYEIAFANEAISSLRDLESELQEDVIDEIERISADVKLLSRRRANDLVVHDLVKERNGIQHFIFIVFRISHARKSLQVAKIGYAKKQSKPQP